MPRRETPPPLLTPHRRSSRSTSPSKAPNCTQKLGCYGTRSALRDPGAYSGPSHHSLSSGNPSETSLEALAPHHSACYSRALACPRGGLSNPERESKPPLEFVTTAIRILGTESLLGEPYTRRGCPTTRQISMCEVRQCTKAGGQSR